MSGVDVDPRPERDPLDWNGLSWRGGSGLPSREPDMVTHEHTCPDGTHLVVTSQLIRASGVVLDRWYVAGIKLAVSSRVNDHHTPPDFTWADQRAPAVQPPGNHLCTARPAQRRAPAPVPHTGIYRR